MSEHLLIELGVEELPAGVGAPAVAALAEKVTAALTDCRITVAGYRLLRTPRRLAVLLEQVAPTGEAVVEEVIGPPVTAAFDQDGNPTRAALGFAKKCGVAVGELERANTDKGEKLVAKIARPAVSLTDVLLDKLPGIIGALPFPKSMCWNETKFTFSRPLRWLVVLYGGKIIAVDVADLTAGNVSQGLRHYPGGKPAPNPVTITAAADYEKILRQHNIIANPDERKKIIRQGARELAAPHLPMDADLLDELADLVEAPVPFKQEFDERYLLTPDPVLEVAMRKHQRYIPVQRMEGTAPTGKLVNFFIGVANGVAEKLAMAMVKEGNLRVLRARFDDAVFFFTNDTSRKLEQYLPRLDDIMYEKNLGSIGDKVRRIEKLTAFIGDLGGFDARTREDAAWIAHLCKADLATEMVFEFPELQGKIGMEYARREGLPENVAVGIGAHYGPLTDGGGFPAGNAAAIVAVADKFDTLVGGFATGKEPTGSADPYALRRQVLGIINIFDEKKWQFSLPAIGEQAIQLIAAKVNFDQSEVQTKINTFIDGRLRAMMKNLTNHSFDEVEAVLSRPWQDIHEIYEKLGAVAALKMSKQYTDVVISLKRVLNIAKGIENVPEEPDAAGFLEEAEKQLYAAAKGMEAAVTEYLQKREYSRALIELSGLRGAIDRLFDDVMVMCEDEQLKRNRLALVKYVGGMFLQIADFTRLREEKK